MNYLNIKQGIDKSKQYMQYAQFIISNTVDDQDTLCANERLWCVKC